MSDPTKDPDDTQPGLTQDPETGVISIGQAASDFSKAKAAKEADENAQAVVQSINDEAASGRAPGSEAGSDQPDAKKNSSS